MPEEAHPSRTVAVPAPTVWPMVLALGLVLVFAGLATSAAVSVLGAAAALAGAVGWLGAVLPREAMETIPEEPPPPLAVTSRPDVVHFHLERKTRRAFLPLEIYPITAGIKGGLAGGAAMAVIASLYALATHHGVWYPINLLAAGFLPGMVSQTTAEIGRFQAGAFAIACAIHLAASVLVGILYGAMLPMLPRRPIVLAGFAAPLLWTALLHSAIGVINPMLNQRIDWPWFVASQIGFGIVAGIVVARQERIPTFQGLPFALRAGIETSRLEDDLEKKP
jgi:hypothetical protein